MTVKLEKLANYQDALLLAEVGAWLHMFGKFHEDFLKGNYDMDKQIPQDVIQNYPLLYNILSDNWTGQIWDQLGIEQLNANQLSIEDLIKQHSNLEAQNGLEKLIFDAHGRGSGIEKGLLYRFAPNQQINVYRSTAFGFEKYLINIEKFNTNKIDLYNYLQSKLLELRKTDAHPPEGWQSFRVDFISKLSELFTLTIAETRRPLNDVTLFDQTVASVAFFKAALAQILFKGWNEPNKNKPVDKYHWRILRIGFNSPAFWSKSLKISDIDARKKLIISLLNEIQQLIETDYPMGYELYRDEMGSIFLMPDVDDLLNANLDNVNTLNEKISEFSKKHLNIEADVYLFPLSLPTRNMLSFGQLASENAPEPSPKYKWINEFQIHWSRSDVVCSVCGLRIQGPNKKALSRNVCNICEKRRTNRAKEWAITLDHTIWIDEIADTNGRIALIVGVFNLNDWLKGGMLNTITSFDPQNRLLNDSKRGSKKYQFDYSQLCQEIQQMLQNLNQTLGGKTLVDNLILRNQRGDSNKFGDIYDLYISDSDLNHPLKEDWRFALAMMRQQPSPARIRRVWETTRRFWEDVHSEFPNVDMIGKAGPRLEISGNLNPKEQNATLGHYHVYTLRLGGIKISVVWDHENKRFITTDNLKYLEQPSRLGEKVEEWLKMQAGKKIKIEEPTGYGSQNKEWGTITIKTTGIISNSTYTPAIPILEEPRTFMALVPADKALDVINKIKDKYEQEMGKVCNRLPLHLGVVFAPYKTPLRAIMDAGQRMLKQTAPMDDWEVVKKECLTADAGSLPETLHKDPHFTRYVHLELTRNDRHVVWHVPYRMGDGKTPDCWYPYVFVKHDKDKNSPVGRRCTFKAPCPWNLDMNNNLQPTWLVHASDLQEGDVIYFTPSTFDFQWLDTSGRRFEIAYDRNGIRLDTSQRPYLLDEFKTLKNIWETISNHLTSTQIHVLRDMIEIKRTEWGLSKENMNDIIFRQFCSDVIANLDWQRCDDKYPWERDEKISKQEWMNMWKKYAVCGWLDDTIELYLQIMNKKPNCRREKSL